MTSAEIRKKFLKFFSAKGGSASGGEKRGHTIVPSSSLIPDDPSVLLTTAGMQQFKPYYIGVLDPEKSDHPSVGNPIGKNAVSIQKCFRTSDIDEVGDESHLTFFEMLGNFSFGGYFKKEAIQYAHEFITKEMGLTIDYVSVFAGGDGVPADEESEEIWKSLGILRIERASRKDNFWGPTGSEGPCGPTAEIYVNSALRQAQGKPPVEVWNLVFNEYYCNPDGSLVPLAQKGGVRGIDTGMGLERLAMVAQNKPTIFDTDLFAPLMQALDGFDIRTKRIIADHLRGAAYLIAEGIEPSNKDRGYVLRRILRRAIFHIAEKEHVAIVPPDASAQKKLGERIAETIEKVMDSIIGMDGALREKKDAIETAVRGEIEKSIEVMRSFSELDKLIEKHKNFSGRPISGVEAFRLFSSFGIPYDFIRDAAQKNGLTIDEKEFENEEKKHQEVSRAGAEKKFGGHGLILNTGELKAGNEEELNKVLRLHTSTHLLQQALREVLGPEVRQVGSDITPERTRFDFAFPRKLTPEEIKKAEDIVNQKIKEDLPVNFVELPKAEAEQTGALFFFREKYPEKVKVYFVGKSLESAWSKEFCGGPHVAHTGEIGKFRIAKEEAVGAGARRIRGVVD